MPDPRVPLAAPEAEGFERMRTTVHALVDARTNLGRQDAVERRAKELGLEPRREWIDWFAWQSNVVIDLPGEGDPRLLYVVAHYDKVDAAPETVPSLLLNGVLDPLVDWMFLSDGAVDNGTGVSVALEVAHRWKSGAPGTRPSLRILLAGAEEMGLRGSRAHVAGLSEAEFARIAAVVNLDSVGLDFTPTCVSTNASDPGLKGKLLEVAQSSGLDLGTNDVPPFAASDYAPFQATSFAHDFGRSLLFNLVGGLLPQRSWFTGYKSTRTLNLSGCSLLDAGDCVASLTVIPVGALHGPRDTAARVDGNRLSDAARLVEAFLRAMAAERVPRAGETACENGLVPCLSPAAPARRPAARTDPAARRRPRT